MRLSRLSLLVVSAVVAGLVTAAQWPAPPQPPLSPRSGPPLSDAKSWGYQLQGARPEFIPPEIDLIVIDHARDSSATDQLTAADVDAFRQRIGLPPRIVLAYVSIGEAETYRDYWWKPWVSKSYFGLLRPSWLGKENTEWRGNYQVRFWQSGWQRLIVNTSPSQLDALRQRLLRTPAPYIDKILAAGFDGVYLDRVDAFSTWEKSHATAEADMSAFVAKISAYAKTRRPGFLIVPQNGEELTRRADYRQVIDGIAKEDLMFGVDGNEKENAADEIAHAAQLLSVVRAAKRPVFVVEYVADPAKRLQALRRSRELGFVVTFANRELDKPPVFIPAAAQAGSAAPAMPPPVRATPKPQP